MTIEVWKPVVGHEGNYEVSDLGRVRSLDRVVMKRLGQGGHPEQLAAHSVKGRVLRRGGRKYPIVALSGLSFAVHILVLTAFRGPCPNGLEACHNDSDSENAALSNLRWDTRLANNDDRRMRGTIPRGTLHGRAVLSLDDVHEIRRLEGLRSARKVAARFGVSATTVRKVQKRQLWAHIGEARP